MSRVKNTVIHNSDGTTHIIIESEVTGLTQVAIIDTEDYDKVKDYTWRLRKSQTKSANVYYAQSISKENYKRMVQMHRLLLDPAKGQMVDHINGNGLDNRRKNLRTATNSQNQYNGRIRVDNPHGYRGVYYEERCPNNPWYTKIQANKGETKIRKGNFSTKEEAAETYDKLAVSLHGEFARLNFPDKLEQYLEEVKNEKGNG